MASNISVEMPEVIKDQDNMGTGGNHEVDMHPSTEESEQDRKVDEALLTESGEGTDNNKKVEEMEVSEKVGDVKPSENMDEGLEALLEGGDSEKADDLENYLEVLMMDSTMSIVKAQKCGDLALILPCPNRDHKVSLPDGTGFFMIDLAEKARLTKEKQLELADFCHELTGCTGHPDCEFSIADAIETDECPTEVFCMEGEVKHLARTDTSCAQHSKTTTGIRQIIGNLIRLQTDMRRAANRAVKHGANLPIIKVDSLIGGRPFLPITLFSGLEVSTLLQGGNIRGGDTSQLPEYLRTLINQVFKRADEQGRPAAEPKPSVAKKTVEITQLSLVAHATKAAKDLSATMRKGYKRKYREHHISTDSVKRYRNNKGELGNPRESALIEPTSYQSLGVKSDWTDIVVNCPVTQQSLEIGHGSVSITSSGGGGTHLHTTKSVTYDPEDLSCRVCEGARKGHSILDNNLGKGLTIILGDQHLPALITTESEQCTVVCRYSNTTLGELHEFFMMPLIKSPNNIQSKDKGGFTVVIKKAVELKLKITLIISSGTSWLQDGPGGYVDAMQVIYDWSQAFAFKINLRDKKPVSLFSTILFPQPMIPYIKPFEDGVQTRTFLTQHKVEATFLARMYVGANCHRSTRSGQSETDLICMDTIDRNSNDILFDALPFSIRPMLKSGTNPVHDRMPVKLRLKPAMNWLTPDRSDENQRLTLKFLVDWTEALIADLCHHASYSEVVTRKELLASRALHNNVLVSEKSWNDQVEALRESDKGVEAFCVHPSVHATTARGSVRAMLKHKAECWNSGEIN